MSTSGFIVILVYQIILNDKESVAKQLGYDSISTKHYATLIILTLILAFIPIFLWINVLVIYFVRRKIAAKVSRLPGNFM